MAVQISVIAAVATLKTVDLSIALMAFPASYAHDSHMVQYDVYESDNGIALKGNFSAGANVVDKGDYKTLTTNAIEVEEKISDNVKNSYKKRIGENDFGDVEGMSESQIRTIEEDIKGFAKLKKRKQRLVKKSIYDVLTTGKIVVSQNGVADDEVDFGLTNIIVNSGTTLWTDAASNPVKQLETEALDLGDFAVDTYVLGKEAFNNFVGNANVTTADNTTSGKKANFTKASDMDKGDRKASTKFMKYIGRTNGQYGVEVDVFVELEKYSGTTAYLNKNYVVGFESGNTENGQIHYAAIPVSEEKGKDAVITWQTGEEWIDAEVKMSPASIQRYYRSSFVTTMNQPKAFISIKATAVA